MTRVFARTAVVLFAMVVCASAATAQTPTPAPGTPSSEQGPPARIQLGPLGVRPAVILREVGYDSNVFNENTGEQGDFTATIGARVDVGGRLTRVLANYSSYYEYLYFKEFDSERGSNRGAEGRLDFLLGRLRPHVLGAVRKSHDRPTPEIDARALRDQNTVGFGVAAAAASHTTVNVAYRRDTAEFAEDEAFRGVNLADELNVRAHAFTYGAAFELTPLTTISAHGEERRERFALSPDRDADSHRYGITASLNPLALISGQATLGVAAFRPRNPLEPDFTGITAAIAVGYAFHDESRLSVTVDRDLRHSVVQETPYYVATGARATYTQRLVRNLDGQLTAGIDRLAYEARLDAAAGNQRDGVKTAGAGVGLRFGEGARLGINYDYTARSSPVASREYSRGRMFATLTYGF